MKGFCGTMTELPLHEDHATLPEAPPTELVGGEPLLFNIF